MSENIEGDIGVSFHDIEHNASDQNDYELFNYMNYKNTVKKSDSTPCELDKQCLKPTYSTAEAFKSESDPTVGSRIINDIRDVDFSENETSLVKSNSFSSKTDEHCLPLIQTAFENKSSVEKENKQFYCVLCDQYFNDHVGLIDHEKRSHSKNHEELENESSVSTKQIENETNPFKSGSMIKIQNDNLTCIVLDSEKRFDTEETELHPLHKEQQELRKILKREICPICFKVYSCSRALDGHNRRVHSLIKRANHTRCVECNLIFDDKQEFRQHLQIYHNLKNMKLISMSFSSMDEFYSWKSSIERKSFMRYQKKNESQGGTMARYYCSRSGKTYHAYKYKGKTYHRMKKLKYGIKLGINCTSEIIVDSSQKNRVLVKFYPGHYGHGKEMAIAQISSQEQEAVKELTSQGIPLEDLIGELKGTEICDYAQVNSIKKRYIDWVNQVYKTDDYNTDISDAECVTQWIQKCCSLDECPILFCHQENIGCSDEKFIIVIMTEFQKHIFMSSSKDIICIDARRRHSNDEVVVIMIIDELNSAFPVAYCLTNALNKDVMMQFLICVKESIGNLTPKYLMSNYRPYIYDSWVKVMDCEPQWLWSRWHMFYTLKGELRRLVKGNVPKRCELFDAMETIIDCKSKSIFSCIFKKFMDKLESDKDLERFRKWVEKNLCSTTDKWAVCYRPEITSLISFHLEAMHFSITRACKLGVKRRKSKFLSVLMTILRNKMFDRIINSTDNLKIGLAVNAIDICHAKGMTISEEKITQLSSKLWLIQDNDGEEEFVSQQLVQCPDHCSLKCESCTICVHHFSCSCLHNMIEANLCRHIHAVAFRVIDHPSSPMPLGNEGSIEDSTFIDDILLPDNTVSFPITQPNSISNLNASTSMNNQPLIPSNHLNNINAISRMEQSFNKDLMIREKLQSEHLFKNKELSPAEKVLQKIMDLYKLVLENNMGPETLKSIQTHLNICSDLVSQKSSPKTKKKGKLPVSLLKPINAMEKEKSFKCSQKCKTSPLTDEQQAKRFKGNKIIVSSSKPVIKMTVSEFLKNKGILVKKVSHISLPDNESDSLSHSDKK